MAVKALPTRVSLLVLLFSSLMVIEAKPCEIDGDNVSCDVTMSDVSLLVTGNIPFPTGHHFGKIPIPTGHPLHSWHRGNSTKTKGWAFPTMALTKTHPAGITASSKPESVGSPACSPTPDSNHPVGKPLSAVDKGIFNVTLHQFCRDFVGGGINLGPAPPSSGDDDYAPDIFVSSVGPKTVQAGQVIASLSVDLVDGAGGSESRSYAVSKSTCMSALRGIISSCQVVEIPDSEQAPALSPWNLGGTIKVADGMGTVEFNASIKATP